MDSARRCAAQLSYTEWFFPFNCSKFHCVFHQVWGSFSTSCVKVSAPGYILLMPKSVLLPLSYILWERLKEREMKRKTLFSISVISFQLESSNILLKLGKLVNGWK